MTVTTSTITGPVGTRPMETASHDPTSALKAPIRPDSSSMLPTRVVHCLAAIGGAMASATMSTSPTALSPITIDSTTTAFNSSDSSRDENPSVAAYSGSKQLSFSSLNAKAATRKVARETTMLETMSSLVRWEALPNRYSASPPLLG